MKLACLFSGGKDSTYALFLAQKYHQVACLITLASHNQDSYMFHTQNIHITKLQSEALQIPQIIEHTAGIKELEIEQLKEVLTKAKNLYGIQGVVTGAVGSIYQATRIQKICAQLKLICFNPLWQINQIDLLNQLVQHDFEVHIAVIAAYPFDESWLGKKIDPKTVQQLTTMQEKYQINPAGEGGEIETIVLNAPHFKKRIMCKKTATLYNNYNGVWQIEQAELMDK